MGYEVTYNNIKLVKASKQQHIKIIFRGIQVSRCGVARNSLRICNIAVH